MNNKTLEMLSATVSLTGLIGGLGSWFTPNITGNVIGATNAAWSGAFLILIGITGSFFWTHYKEKNQKKPKIKVVRKKPKRKLTKKKKRR
jgi:nitrate/nitrite transporter NarK